MENIYKPTIAKITKIEDHSPSVKLFRLEPTGFLASFPRQENGLVFIPGQFVLVGQIGYGEGPFGVLSSPDEDKYLEILVRKVGRVTDYLHSLKEGDEVTVRGPYGNGFDLGFLEGKDILGVTGGCGIPPIAALLEYIVLHREKFNNVYLLYGAKSPDEILMKNQMEEWKKKDIKVLLTIDKEVAGWNGPVGLVTGLLGQVQINEPNTAVMMCGPVPMISAIQRAVKPMGIPDRRIFVSLERNMQCGVGKCQHCTCGEKYVCMDGPVFNYDEIDKITD